MKTRIVVLAAAFGLVAFSFVSAQEKTPDYAGKWKLDVSKSELGERSRIESMDMTVEQSSDTMSVERTPKFAENGGGGMGGRGRRMMGGGKLSYDLSGKESKGEMPMGGEMSLKAETGKSGGLTLTQKRNLETPMGSVSIKTVEKWTISDDGKVLTIDSSTETPRGNRTQKLVFLKQ